MEKSVRLLNLYAKWNRERYENLGKKVIAVLGSFDTWSYMEYTCRQISRLGHYVPTSIREYFVDDKGIVKWKERDDVFKSILMRESMRFMIFDEAHEVIIIYSVPGAHYIETDWCFQRLDRDSGFQCYGITLVRKIRTRDNCPFLERSNTLDVSKCAASSSRTAWECVGEEKFCPFKEQGIAKNVIEYFFGKRRMKLFAVERLDVLSQLYTHSFSNLTEVLSIFFPFSLSLY